jgi:hypothetical protein
MNITRTSLFSRVTRTLDLPVTEAQLDAWASGELIQNAFPDLSPDDREFLKTGITPEEWEMMFAEDVEDKDMAEEMAASESVIDQIRANCKNPDDLAKIAMAIEAMREELIEESTSRFERATHA